VVRSGHGFFSFTIVSPFLFGNFSGWNVVMVSRLKTKRRPLEPLEESTEIRGYARPSKRRSVAERPIFQAVYAASGETSTST
jgi:hypothetical protein